EPSVDTDIQILHITGLENFVVPHPFIHQQKFSPATLRATPDIGTGPTPITTPNATPPTSTLTSYIGNDFRMAYIPSVSITGTGQSVGLYELDGFYANDITNYVNAAIGSGSNLSLPVINGPTVSTNNVTSVYVDGYNFDSSPGGGEDEVTLDIDMVLCMAPGAQVFVYEGSYSDDVLAAMADPPAGIPLSLQLSSSWSTGNPDNDPLMANALAEMALQGQSFFQAAGDWGAYPYDPGDIRDEKYATVVGGTTLYTNNPTGTPPLITYPNPYYQHETTWNYNITTPTPNPTPGDPPLTNEAGGGGICNGLQDLPTILGISTPVIIPTYQVPYINGTNKGSTAYRNLPDVSMIADNIFNIAFNGQYIGPVGGTSAATPLWASVMALINQQAFNQGLPSVGFANYALYTLATTNSGDFNSITLGTNGGYEGPVYGYNPGFPAVAGYNLATGLGSPNGQQNLINDLVGLIPTPTPIPVNTSSWVQATPAASFSPRFDQGSVYFNNQIWVIGGQSPAPFDPNNPFYTTNEYNDVWASPNGVNWTSMNSGAPFSGRDSFGTLVYNNKIWVIGGHEHDNFYLNGQAAHDQYFNDVWSSPDGVNWTQVTANAAFSGRSGFGALVFPDPNNSGKLTMWVIGGSTPEYGGGVYIGNQTLADVWSSTDGITWNPVTPSAAFGPRANFGCVAFNNGIENQMWIMDGGTSTDVWSSPDGITWTPATTNPAFGQILQVTSQSYDGQMWVLGGQLNDNGLSSSVWYSNNGSTWNLQSSSPGFTPRSGQSSVVADNRMWLIGGQDSSGPRDDVWYFPPTTPTPTPTPGGPCYATTPLKVWGPTFTGGSFTQPKGVAANGNNYVMVLDNNSIDTFSPNGTYDGLWYPLTFSKAEGIAMDNDDDVFVTDSTTGTAGAGIVYVFYYNGANETYTDVTGFSNPQGVATDNSFNFYVADSGSGNIVEFYFNPNTASFNFETQWGPSFFPHGPQQVALDHSGTHIYVSDYPNGPNTYPRIQEFPITGEGVAPAAASAYWYPNGTSGAETITGMVVGPDGNLYVSDLTSTNSQIIVQNPNNVVNGSTGNTLETLQGTKSTAAGSSENSAGIAFDGCGNLYQADSSALTKRVQVFGLCGSTCQLKTINHYIYNVSSSIGGPGSGNGNLNHETGVAVSGPYVYAADTQNNRIEKFDVNGDWIANWGGPASGSGNGQFNAPSNLSVAPGQGNIYVSDTGNNRVEVLDLNGNFKFTFGGPGSGNGLFNAPEGIVADSSNNIYVVDSGNNRVEEFGYVSGNPGSVTFVGQWGAVGTGNGQFNSPMGIAEGPVGPVTVGFTGGNLRNFVSKGKSVILPGLTNPTVNGIFVVDAGNYRVQAFNTNGVFQGQFGTQGTGTGQFQSPYGVAVGSDGNLYVSDSTLNTVQQMNYQGLSFNQFGGPGQPFTSAMGVAFDSCGNLYAADAGSSVMDKFNLTGSTCSITVPPTPTPVFTNTVTNTPTNTPSNTTTPTATSTSTNTATNSPTNTPTNSITNTATLTATSTPTPTLT
ncbi:MAG TPA: hypothetical protein VK859_08530, partial [bacterium]|nr:hypothetical protein [bacterium]